MTDATEIAADYREAADTCIKWLNASLVSMAGTTLGGILAASRDIIADGAVRIESQAAEIARLQAGGCARDQTTTQFCAEAAAFAREIAELRAEVERLRAGGWRPISEAPKDGTDILVGIQAIGWPVRVAFWDEARGGVWSIWPGRELTHPTHWVSLPPPPTDASEPSDV